MDQVILLNRSIISTNRKDKRYTMKCDKIETKYGDGYTLNTKE